MTPVLYDDVNGRADVIVAGEWLHNDPDDYGSGYKLGYAATLFQSGWWSGGCSPIMERDVVEQLVTDQNGYADAFIAQGGTEGDVGRLEWDGDVLVCKYGEPDDWVRSEPTPDGYDVGFGWTWTPVGYSDCKEVVGDAPRVVTVRFTYPQSLLDKHGEDDLVGSVQARMEEFYVGPDNDCFVTGHVAVTVED